MNTLGYAGPPLNSSTRLSWYPGKPSSCLGRFSPLGYCFFGSVWTLCVAGCLERRVFSFVCVGERSQLCDRFYTRLGFSWQVYSQAIKHSRRSHRTDPGYDRIKRKPERDLASKKLPFFRKLWWPERVRVSWSTKLLQAPFLFKSCSLAPRGLSTHRKACSAVQTSVIDVVVRWEKIIAETISVGTTHDQDDLHNINAAVLYSG